MEGVVINSGALGGGRKKWHQGGPQVFYDVPRAYFHAAARRKVYVELPGEDYEEGMCGRLVKAMYGTRDAAQNWEYEYSAMMSEAGFAQGKSNPCVFRHKGRRIIAVVHGDDFTVGGYVEDLDWFKGVIQGRMEVKHNARLGGDPEDDKHVRVLNTEWPSGRIGG